MVMKIRIYYEILNFIENKEETVHQYVQNKLHP